MICMDILVLRVGLDGYLGGVCGFLIKRGYCF